MKTAIYASSLLAASAAFGSIDVLISGWDFSNLSTGTFDGSSIASTEGVESSIINFDGFPRMGGVLSGTGTLTANSTFQNSLVGEGFETSGTRSLLTVNTGSADPSGEMFTFEYSGSQVYQELELFYATDTNNAGVSADLVWMFSSDGGSNFVEVETIASTSNESGQSVDFTAITSSPSNNFVIGLQIGSGDLGTFEGVLLDNVAIYGAVPEPSAYAAIAGALVLGFAVIRRRRRS